MDEAAAVFEALVTDGDSITALYIVRNPDKLRHLEVPLQ